MSVMDPLRALGLTRRTALGGLAATPSVAYAPVGVRLDTDHGALDLRLRPDRAPRTAANFLAYVDHGLLVGAALYRVVRPDNDPSPYPIHVVQGGLLSRGGRAPRAPIAHEPTDLTGLRHRDGAISMARAAPGTASSEFFICLGDNPELDAGGRRHPDGHGYAAFGCVVAGLEWLRTLDAAEMGAGPPGAPPHQWLVRPVGITAARRTSG
jgi:peptidyl-prolyl cis-trans isomerase A (cyclophilin A)